MRIFTFVFILFLLGRAVSFASSCYVVKSGDSLISISKRLGINFNTIKQLNPGVNWLRIKPGDKIALPRPKPTRILYTVKEGDSLRKIALKFGVSLDELKASNPKLHWPIIRPNDKIIILKRREALESSKDVYKSNIYIVKKHDSLESIARKFHVDIREVKKLNPDIDWSRIMPNDKIKLSKSGSLLNTPNLKEAIALEEKRYYIVKKGDTLNNIARRFKITLEQLKRLNIGISGYLRPGDMIVVPKTAKNKKVVKTNKFKAHSLNLVYSSAYRIRRGDSLLKIAKMFNTTVETLRMINNINGSVIRVGEVLYVPNQDTAERIKMELQYSLIKHRRDALISYAERFLGRPYRFGGTSLKSGIDCSAFVQKIYNKFNVKIPRTAQSQYEKAGVFVPVDRLKKGDLLFFHTLDYSKVTHVGIYIGDDSFIHAAGRRAGIRISKLDGYYKKTLVGAKRVLGIDNRYAYFRR